MTTTELVLVGLVMLAGLIGVAVPLLPGLLLVLAGAIWWTLAEGGGAARWVILGLIAAVLVVGTALKYLVAARTTAAAGTATRSMVFAVLLGVVGFFVIPVVGAPFGFVLGIYLAERPRLGGHPAASASTRAALKGVALSILVEFTAGVVMIAIWLVGVLVT